MGNSEIDGMRNIGKTEKEGAKSTDRGKKRKIE